MIVSVPCPKDKWTPIASDVVEGSIYITQKGNYHFIHVPHGSEYHNKPIAPAVESTYIRIQSDYPIDIYAKCTSTDGLLTVST